MLEESEPLDRLEIRGGRSPDEYIGYLRQKIQTAQLSDAELREMVRIHRDSVVATGSLGAVQKEPKAPKAKGGKAKPAVNIDDLFGELDGLI